MKSIIIVLFLPLCCVAQQSKPLQIGDTLSYQLITSLSTNLQRPAGNQQLATRNQYILLDFWATWCTSCLQHFPLQDSLQKKFKGQLQFILVNEKSSGDNDTKITAFFEKHRLSNGQKFLLPYIVGDTILSALFPHKLLPHYVWIKDSKVVAITGGEEITEQNIRAFINNSSLHLPLKKDITDYDPALPLLENGNGGDASELMYRSTLTTHLDGLGTAIKKTSGLNSQKLIFINHSVLSLYQWVLKFSPNRVVLEVKDSSLYLESALCGWKTHQYGYEITAPSFCSASRLNDLMLADWDRLFAVKGRMEKRMMSCWSLVRLPVADSLLKTKGAKPSIEWYSTVSPFTVLTNHPLSKLIDMFNRQTIAAFPFRPVVIDETGYTKPVDIKLNVSLDDFNVLKKELNKYGLDLIQVKRILDVFVLTESTNKNE
jgi:thiol-disulfide isomerase/thioredoxin